MQKWGKWIAGFLVLTVLLGVAAGCGKTTKQDFITAQNIMENSKGITSEGKQSSSGALKAGANGFLEITFPQETAVNTVVLREKGSNILRFRIEAMQNGKYETIYEQDKVEEYRYCAFPTIKTTGLKITLLKVRDGETAALQSTEVYNIQNDASKKTRVTSYVVANSVYDKKKLDAKHFDVITDVILFGATSFDESGKLVFNEAEVDGKKVDGQKVFEQALANLREISRQKAVPLKIYVNLLGPGPKEEIADWNESQDAKAQLHAKAMKDNRDVLTGGISSMLQQYQLDGVFFDYEFPLKKSHWTMFGDFLIALKDKIGDKTLGAAFAPWGVNLSKEAIDSIDLVEIMSYDLFDKDGDHAPFYSCGPAAVDFFVKKGFDKARLDLGVPFYARPADGGGFWYDYASEAKKLGKFGNVATGKASDSKDPCETRYYNGYQMTYDKTAYAVNAGVGGMMVWHYSCDLPYDDALSLFRAMGEAIKDRK